MIESLNEGIAFHKSGKLDKAKKIYEKIIKKYPNNFEVINLLGIISLQLKNYNEAIILINKAIGINPNHHALYNNLGVSYKELFEHDNAIKAFNKAIELNPIYAEAYNNLGIVYKNINQYDEAYKNYSKSIELKVNYAEAYNNLGVLYKELKKYDEAITVFSTAIELNKNYYQAYENRADTYFVHSRYLLAIEDYSVLKELNPEKKNLYEISIFTIKNLICDWKDYKEEISNFEEKLKKDEVIIDPMHVLRCLDSLNIIKNNSKRYNESYNEFNLGNFSKKKLNYKIKEKIKIGYYSADFRSHPVGHLISDLLECHDKKNFEIIGFYFDKYPDDKVTKRISKAFDKLYYTKNFTNEDIVLKSRNEEVDIAVDLMGYTRNNRTNIFLQQLAPIQVNFLGYPGTTAHNINYIIADKYLIPNENQKFYFEKIIYMPDCYQPSDSKRNVLIANYNHKVFNFVESNIKLCCLNEPSKISPLIFNSWMQILKKTKNTVLFLLEFNSYYKHNLTNEAKKQGIESGRLIFLPKLPYEEHLIRFKFFDLFLDTFPYSAHTTANEALWSGVPLISLAGQSFQSRVSSSLLYNLEMDDLITHNLKDYEELAVLLGNNPSKLKEIKNKLLNNAKKTNVFNTKIYTSNLEKAYKQIYEAHKNNLKLDHIYLN